LIGQILIVGSLSILSSSNRIADSLEVPRTEFHVHASCINSASIGTSSQSDGLGFGIIARRWRLLRMAITIKHYFIKLRNENPSAST
jgi:hypothetical protein